MATVEAPVVVCTYLVRDHADEFVAVLRKLGIATVAVPSDQDAGAWDVMVPGHSADRVKKIVNDMLELH
jgi:hypothetical protein